MVGGTTSGYSLIGNRPIAIHPRRKIIVESTPAKMGRRMKKWEKFIICCGSGRRFEGQATRLTPRGLQFGSWTVGDFFLGRDRHAGPNALQAVDHNDFVRLQA